MTRQILNLNKSKSKIKLKRNNSSTSLSPLLHHQGISLESHNSKEELQVLKSIIAREVCIDRLVKELCNFDTDNRIKIMKLLLQLRELSLETVERIAKWRMSLVKPIPFTWNQTNYLLKMTSDLDFLNRSKIFLQTVYGKLEKRNPFLIMGGLDHFIDYNKSIHLEEWSYENDDDEDNDMTTRIKRASRLILLEEKLNNSCSVQSMNKIQNHLSIIMTKEAEYAKRANKQKHHEDDHNVNNKK